MTSHSKCLLQRLAVASLMAVAVAISGCSHNAYLSGAASMRIEVDVYKGPLSNTAEVQKGQLSALLRSTRSGINHMDGLLIDSMCRIGCIRGDDQSEIGFTGSVPPHRWFTIPVSLGQNDREYAFRPTAEFCANRGIPQRRILKTSPPCVDSSACDIDDKYNTPLNQREFDSNDSIKRFATDNVHGRVEANDRFPDSQPDTYRSCPTYISMREQLENIKSASCVSTQTLAGQSADVCADVNRWFQTAPDRFEFRKSTLGSSAAASALSDETAALRESASAALKEPRQLLQDELNSLTAKIRDGGDAAALILALDEASKVLASARGNSPTPGVITSFGAVLAGLARPQVPLTASMPAPAVDRLLNEALGWQKDSTAFASFLSGLSPPLADADAAFKAAEQRPFAKSLTKAFKQRAQINASKRSVDALAKEMSRFKQASTALVESLSAAIAARKPPSGYNASLAAALQKLANIAPVAPQDVQDYLDAFRKRAEQLQIVKAQILLGDSQGATRFARLDAEIARAEKIFETISFVPSKPPELPDIVKANADFEALDFLSLSMSIPAIQDLDPGYLQSANAALVDLHTSAGAISSTGSPVPAMSALDGAEKEIANALAAVRAGISPTQKSELDKLMARLNTVRTALNGLDSAATNLGSLPSERDIAASEKAKRDIDAYASVAELAGGFRLLATTLSYSLASTPPTETRLRIDMVKAANLAAEFANQFTSRSNALSLQTGANGVDRRALSTGQYLRDAMPTAFLDAYDWYDAATEYRDDPADRIPIAKRLFADDNWSRINEVYASGAGDVSMAFIRDDIGNWNLKQFSSDASEITAAYTRLGIGIADKVLGAVSGGGTTALSEAKGLLGAAQDVQAGNAANGDLRSGMLIANLDLAGTRREMARALVATKQKLAAEVAGIRANAATGTPAVARCTSAEADPEARDEQIQNCIAEAEAVAVRKAQAEVDATVRQYELLIEAFQRVATVPSPEAKAP